MKYDALQLLSDFGPALATATFTLLSGTITIFIFIAKKILRVHRTKITKIAEAINSLSQHQNKLWSTMQTLHSQLEINNRQDGYFKDSILKLEGTIKSQQDMLYTHIDRISKVDSKLDAVFKFIEAPKRATDG